MTHLPYKKVTAWQRSMTLVQKIYEITQSFPSYEAHGLRSQMTRAAVSVPSNIAEGSARETHKDYAHFLTIAYSSLAELNTQVIIALNLEYISKEEALAIEQEITEISKILYVFKRNLRHKTDV